MSTIKMRDYQREAIDAVYAGWERFDAPAVVLPTGTGKTVIFSGMADEIVAAGGRPWVLVHRDELVKQTVAKLTDANPYREIGVVQAERSELGRSFTVASVATLARRARRELIDPSLCTHLIVDECHHATAVSYRAVRDHFAGAKIVGFTATMQRGDRGHLGDVWDDVVYSRSIEWAISAGHLVDVRGKRVTIEGLSLADVARKRGGDYADGSLGEALAEVGAGEAIAQAYKDHAGDRQGVVFAPTVATAQAFCDALNMAGIVSEVVIGATETEDRALTYKRVLAGETQVICSCMVLTEGFDMPQLSCAVIARPTTNQGLYVQMAGRVLRPSPGKTDALIIDIVGVTNDLALANLASLTHSRVLPEEDETLMQAVTRKSSKPGVRLVYAGELDGDIEVTEVKLFARSRSVWLRTHGGKWFIPTRSCVYFLWPADGGTTFAVGRSASAYQVKGKGAGWLADGHRFELSMAMAWAEEEAIKTDPSIASRDAAWRRGPHPSTAQLDLARRERLVFPEGIRKDAASDMLSVHFASRMLDR